MTIFECSVDRQASPHYTYTNNGLLLTYDLFIQIIQMLTLWRCDAVSFSIKQSSYLCESAVSCYFVLDGRGLHEECVIPLEDPLLPFAVGLREDGRTFGLHEGPHLLVHGDLGILDGRENKIFLRMSFVIKCMLVYFHPIKCMLVYFNPTKCMYCNPFLNL